MVFKLKIIQCLKSKSDPKFLHPNLILSGIDKTCRFDAIRNNPTKSTINYPFLAQSNVNTTVSTDGIFFYVLFAPVCQWLICRCFWERIFSNCFTKSTSIRGVDFTWVVFTWKKPAFLPGMARLSYLTHCD